MFLLLMDVSGIGPKLAICALSGLSVRELVMAIGKGDVKRLSSISGIGRKTAERMVVELKDRITQGELLEAVSGADGDTESDALLRDAVLALIELGYKQESSKKMVLAALKDAPEGAGVGDLIRRALAGKGSE
jgi:Holliday junction DNA helicase RuvA